jgi:hypothetical protein
MADSSAFAKIVDGHHAEIRRYLRRVAPHRADADALCEETFVRALRAHRSLTAGRRGRARVALRHRHPSLSDTSIGAQVIVRQVGERTAVRGRRPDTGRRGLRHPNVEPAGTGNRTSRGRAAPRSRHAKLHHLDYAAIGACLDCSAETARTLVLEAMRKIRHGLEAFPAGARIERERPVHDPSSS